TCLPTRSGSRSLEPGDLHRHLAIRRDGVQCATSTLPRTRALRAMLHAGAQNWRKPNAAPSRAELRLTCQRLPSTPVGSRRRQPMKQAMVGVSKALIRGLLIVVPVYLAILLLLKGMKSVANLVRALTALLPDWVPAVELLSLPLVLAICAVIGATVGTRIGRGARDWLERSVFERIP